MGARRGAVCPICDKQFAQAYSLTIHMRIHNGDKPFPCSVCGRRFTQAHSRTKHERTHTGERLHGCPVCGKRFGEPFMLKRHMRVHTGDKPFRCLECGRSFSDKFGLKRHLKTHVSVKAHVCPDCGESFSNSWLLATHQLQHMGISAPGSSQGEFPPVPGVLKRKPGDAGPVAPAAAAAMQQAQEQQQHIQAQAGVQVVHIQQVSQAPPQVHNQAQHEPAPRQSNGNVPTGKKKTHICLVCGKGYSDAWGLSKHSWVHTGVKPYSCSECGKGFGDKWSLTKHMRVHSGERPYECFLCGQCFPDKTALQTHLQVHTGEKPYICDICGKCFAASRALEDHRANHGDRDQHSCPVCTRVFMTKRGVTDHWKKHCGKDNPSAIETLTTVVENTVPTTLCTVELKPEQELATVALVTSPEYQSVQVAQVTPVQVVQAQRTQVQAQQAEAQPQGPVQVQIQLQAGKDLWPATATWESTSILEVPTSASSGKLEAKITPIFFCEICHKTFRQLSQLEKHKAVHTSGSKGKEQPEELQISRTEEQEQAGQEQQHRCDSCEKTFASLSCYKAHVESEGCPKNCALCGKTYRTINPSGTRVTTPYCETCAVSQQFDGHADLTVPKRSQHPPWSFDATQMTFQKHISVHSDGTKPCSCGHCDGMFSSHTTLPAHVLSVPTAGV